MLHHDTKRLTPIIDGMEPHPDFRLYDDLDAISDLPAALFYEELLAAYPQSKCILTIRDEDAWWRSIHRHFTERNPISDPSAFAWKIRSLAYGSALPNEFVYRKRYREHNERVQRVVPRDKLLVLDVTEPDAFRRLASFVGREVGPDRKFPHINWAEPPVELEEMAHTICEATPLGAKIALVDGGLWWEGLSLPQREVVRVAEGPPMWGTPRDGQDARQLLVDVADAGVEYFVMTATTFWWLEHYPELGDILAVRADTVHSDLRLMVYRLNGREDS